jgi:hypothetical protein
MTSERMKSSLGIGFEHGQAEAMVVVSHSAPQDAKQMVQWLKLGGVRGQVDQFQPAATALQQRGDLSRFLRPVDVGIVSTRTRALRRRPRERQTSVSHRTQKSEAPSLCRHRLAGRTTLRRYADRRDSATVYVEDETELALLPTLTRCWMRRGHQRKIPAPGTNTS